MAEALRPLPPSPDGDHDACAGGKAGGHDGHTVHHRDDHHDRHDHGGHHSALERVAARRLRHRSRARVAWLAGLAVFTAAVQLALIAIVCAGATGGGGAGGGAGGGGAGALPASWFGDVHLYLARAAGSRRVLSQTLRDAAAGPQQQQPPLQPGEASAAVVAPVPLAPPLPCECNLSLPLNETALLAAAVDWAPGGADAPNPCLLASADATGACRVNFDPPLPPGDAAERARVMDALRRADRAALRRRYDALLDADRPEAAAARAQRLATVGLSVVAMAVFCRREVQRAMIVARVVLSHAGGFLPPFYAPLFLAYADAPAPRRLGWPAAAALMAAPLLQATVALGVLLAVSVTTLSSALASEPIAVLFNSVALLFVLEVCVWGGARGGGGALSYFLLHMPCSTNPAD